MSKQNPKTNWMSGAKANAKATMAKAAATVAVRRKKGSEQLNIESVGESLVLNNPLPVPDGGSESVDTRDYSHDMPLLQNGAAPGSQHLPQSANTRNLPPGPPLNINNTSGHGMRKVEPNNQFRRMNGGDNTDDLHSTLGDEFARSKNQLTSAQKAAKFDDPDRKPVAGIVANSQDIHPTEDIFVDCSEVHRNDQNPGTRKAEEGMKQLLEPATSNPHQAVSSNEYTTLKGEKQALETQLAMLKQENDQLASKYATLSQEKQTLERKNTNLEANHKFSQGECARLRKDNESLGKEKQRLDNDIQARKEREDTLSRDYQDLLAQNLNLGRDRDHWVAQHTSLSDAYKHEKSRITSLEAALEAKQKELEQDKISNAGLLESHARIERENGELRNVNGQLRTTQEDIKRLKNQNKRLATQLSNYTFEGSVYSVDDYFQQEWKNLDAMIVNWSHHIFKDNSDSFLDSILKKSPKLSEAHVLRRVAADPVRYLTNSTRRTSFVQAFVWSILVEQVFTPPGGYGDSDLCGLYWSGSVRGELDTICGYLHPGKPSKLFLRRCY